MNPQKRGIPIDSIAQGVVGREENATNAGPR